MKKFYLLAAFGFFFIGFANSGHAQNTAIRSGNWSNPITWDVNGIPSAACNACSITINSGITVTLDADVTLSNASRLTIGTNSTAAKLVINSSGTAGGFLGVHNRIILDNNSSASTIKLLNANATIDASAAGPYDGIFNVTNNRPGIVSFYSKLVGNDPADFIVNPGNIIVSNHGPATFGTGLSGPITLSSTGALPVLLVNFNAVLDNNVVNLSWTTAEEINSNHFAVERSTDASHWQTIGTVTAKGFSSIAVNYSFIDESPSSGVNYYRLQIVDNDGKYKYSAVKVVRSSLTKGLSVFPNPANNFVNVTLGVDMGSGTTLRLINQYGQVLLEKKLSHAAGTTISLPINNYPQGNYILQVIGEDGGRQSGKLLISR